MKILLTSTSFHDTPGKHQELLSVQDFDVDVLRGPLAENDLLPIIQNYDALICGDDEYTKAVLIKGKNGRLKYISKYGVGLDKIDLKTAKKLGIPIANCAGVNQISVAEHVFALLLCFTKNICTAYQNTRAGKWKRTTGREIFGKTIGIIGLGAIGKEVAIRAKALGLKVLVYDKFLDEAFVKNQNIAVASVLKELFNRCNIISLHTPLNSETEYLINKNILSQLKKEVIIINTARGKLVENQAIVSGIKEAIIGGYLTDVLDIEPMPENHPLKNTHRVLITPHIGSRTFESVEKQGTMAVQNLLHLMKKS